MRRAAAVARPPIGPRPAAGLVLAGSGAGFAGRVGWRLEGAIISAIAIDRIFDGACPRFDHAGATHTGDAARCLYARHYFALEKTHRRRTGRRWIGKAPRPAILVVFAAACACCGIAIRHRSTGIIAAGPVKAGLRPAWRNIGQGRKNQHGQARQECPRHCANLESRPCPNVPPAQQNAVPWPIATRILPKSPACESLRAAGPTHHNHRHPRAIASCRAATRS